MVMISNVFIYYKTKNKTTSSSSSSGFRCFCSTRKEANTSVAATATSQIIKQNVSNDDTSFDDEKQSLKSNLSSFTENNHATPRTPPPSTTTRGIPIVTPVNSTKLINPKIPASSLNNNNNSTHTLTSNIAATITTSTMMDPLRKSSTAYSLNSYSLMRNYNEHHNLPSLSESGLLVNEHGGVMKRLMRSFSSSLSSSTNALLDTNNVRLG